MSGENEAIKAFCAACGYAWTVPASIEIGMIDCPKCDDGLEVNPTPYTCKHDCERDALKDEITRLRVELAQARDKALEEAAAWHETEAKKLSAWASHIPLLEINNEKLSEKYKYMISFHCNAAYTIRAMKGKQS